jgi:uncharacterized protein YxjI
VPATAPARLAFNIAPGESYTIRRKILKVFGAAFHIYDPHGGLVGYCKQKAFKLKEDIRIYPDESCSQEWLIIKARSIIDFGTTYDVTPPDGTVVGSLRRKGLTSTFIRDSWLVFNHENRQVATITEDGDLLALARRFVEFDSVLCPQRFTLAREDGTPIARYRQHFNLFVYRLGVAVEQDDPDLNDLVILAAGCLIAAIEGRQSGG